jgi:uracil-DNA glycosylase
MSFIGATTLQSLGVDKAWLTQDFKQAWTSLLPHLQNINKDSVNKKVFPSKSEDVFKVFTLYNPKQIDVVILGQDPYYTEGYATGLAFDTTLNNKPPRSLVNILKKIEQETGSTRYKNNKHSYLEHFVEERVLLLNTALTVVEGEPESHLNYWKEFTADLIMAICKLNPKCIFILWGKKAQQFEYCLGENNMLIKGGHPSPLSQKSFFKTNYFHQLNKSL